MKTKHLNSANIYAHSSRLEQVKELSHESVPIATRCNHIGTAKYKNTVIAVCEHGIEGRSNGSWNCSFIITEFVFLIGTEINIGRGESLEFENLKLKLADMKSNVVVYESGGQLREIWNATKSNYLSPHYLWDSMLLLDGPSFFYNRFSCFN